MNSTDYNETVEARRFTSDATHFYTADEQAVFDALRADAVRAKARFGLRSKRREYWEQELAAVADALPMDDPLVTAALADGEIAFRNRVSDRIWSEHQSMIEVPRCPKCERILRTAQAQQCFWCGYDWH